MVDVVDKATRSRMMSGIRAKNTRPEMFLRRGLHAIGFRFRLHATDIPGKPDIVLPKYRALIVVHGCFWHGHECRYFRLPSTRREFWVDKIANNRARDERNLIRQFDADWRVLVVWECAIRVSMKSRPAIDTITLAADWLRSGGVHAEVGECGIVNLDQSRKKGLVDGRDVRRSDAIVSFAKHYKQ